ncbi:deoxyribonuclease-4 [Peribacillus deserti]|uniref:Deoxyribonuclease-4 n=1 Tax=Peribacillus deserti TaxID=673318 RepID=A0ABS2QG22_9BACI|nr:deoxyribonuclease IV [Peribacillus deserti]MBM7691241.1 deoxyribonuclease-4 [Peribacillus deserti]
MRFGCHVSIREGYLAAAKHAHSIQAQAYQYFLKNPRSLSVKDFDRGDAEACKEFCLSHSILSIAHTPYPTSITPSDDKKDAVVESLLNDLEIADACGSVGVVVHFGSQINPASPLESYQLMIEVLNSVTSGWEGTCKILLENNAGIPGTIGTTLEELVQVRNLCGEPQKIGFCLDTCHAFASGLWTGDNWKELSKKGKELDYFKELSAVHLNNSKYGMGQGKDRHANIFNAGHINEEQFEELIHSPLLKDVLFVLETPKEYGISHKEEIEQLYSKWG